MKLRKKKRASAVLVTIIEQAHDPRQKLITSIDATYEVILLERRTSIAHYFISRN